MTTLIPSGAIVVGIDGSSASDLALDWAAREASSEGRALVLLHALQLPSVDALAARDATGFQYADLLDQLRRDADDLLAEKSAKVQTGHAPDNIHRVVTLSDAREALLDAAREASMLVVGTRGNGPIRQLLLGSVSLTMTKHSGAPVVVVRPATSGTRDLGVVVGVAGDHSDDQVLDFAFQVAHARGLPVTAAHTFWDAVAVDDEAREVGPDEPGHEEQRALLADAVRGPSHQYPEVPVRQLLSRGFADVQLIAASEHADLLVLGHRRKPFLREFIYGSVAPRVVEHARCSVAVVPVAESPEVSSPDPE